MPDIQHIQLPEAQRLTADLSTESSGECTRLVVHYLVEDECLADVTPAAGGRSVVEDEEQSQKHQDAGGGVDGVDDKHHHQTAYDAQQTGVPGEELEGRPEGDGGVEE